MGYEYGASTAPARARKTRDQIREELEHLRRIEASITAETLAKNDQLARIRAARKRLEPEATYQPTPEQLEYRDAHLPAIQAQPKPVWGGQHNLHLAALEAAGWDQEHRRGAQPPGRNKRKQAA